MFSLRKLQNVLYAAHICLQLKSKCLQAVDFFEMPSLRDVRECLLLSHALHMLDDEEFTLLYDLNRSKNPDLPYWNYNFDFDSLTDDECKAEFRFFLNDVYIIKDVLNIPDTYICNNRLTES